MARLPTVDGDNDAWGTILNDFLSVSLNGDGTINLVAAEAAGLAPITSPMFLGTPSAPTASPGTNTTQLATTAFVEAAVSGGGLGTVTTVSVVSANGLAGTVANATTTPAIALSTSVSGLLKGNGTAISAATANTDYLPPSNATMTGVPTAPTAGPGTNTTQLATTAFTETAVAFETARAEAAETALNNAPFDKPGAAGAASLRGGLPNTDAGGTKFPIVDLTIGDSIAAGVGAYKGVTDWATKLANIENRTAGLPDAGCALIQANTFGDLSSGALVTAIAVASVTLSTGSATVTAASFPGVVPGQVVTVSGGTGTLPANTYVVSVSAGNCVLSANPSGNGTATLSFSANMTQGVSVPGVSTAWAFTSSQAIGDGVTKTGATVTVASVTTTSGSATATVASGGFPGAAEAMQVSGTGIAFGSMVAAISANTLTLSVPATASGTVTLTFSRTFRRVQVYYSLVNNGDNVIFTTVGGTGSTSSSLSTHSTTGGIGMWDSGDETLPCTGLYATGATHSAGAGGGGVIILAARYFVAPVDGVVIDNVGFGGTWIETWEGGSAPNGAPTAWAALIQAMAQAGQPYRRVYIIGGLNDAAIGVPATNISAAYSSINATILALSPTTEPVFIGEHYGDGLTTFASVGTVNLSPTLSSSSFSAGFPNSPTVGSRMYGPGIPVGSTVLAVTAGSPPTVTLSQNATATATVTTTEIFQRQGPVYWQSVINNIQAAAQSANAPFINLFAMGGDFAPRAQVASITTTTASATVTNSGGWLGVAVGQRVAGTSMTLAQDTLVKAVAGTTLTLTIPVVAGGTGTLTFYEDELGVSNGGLHWGDTTNSISGRDGHRMMAEAIYSGLKYSKHVQPLGVIQTGVPNDGAIRATLPYNAPDDGPSWEGFAASTDTQPMWSLRAGFLTSTGLFMGPGGQTTPDSYVVRNTTNVIQVPSLKVAGLNSQVNNGARWVGATSTGIPASGTFAQGDMITTGDGDAFICTTGGTPGVWQQVGGGRISTLTGSSGTFTPLVNGVYKITCVGGGGQGGGGGSPTNASATLQAGGSGGGQGESKTHNDILVGGTGYTFTIGAGGTGSGAGGAGNGSHAGAQGAVGGATTFNGNTNVVAAGGGGGGGAAGNSVAAAVPGAYSNGNTVLVTVILPGMGGVSNFNSFTAATGGGGAVGSGVGGGGGGGQASSTLGGGGGAAAAYAVAQGGTFVGLNGFSGTSAGVVGFAAAANTGGGGGGGGGGAGTATSGAGGTGGAGGSGLIIIEGPL